MYNLGRKKVGLSTTVEASGSERRALGRDWRDVSLHNSRARLGVGHFWLRSASLALATRYSLCDESRFVYSGVLVFISLDQDDYVSGGHRVVINSADQCKREGRVSSGAAHSDTRDMMLSDSWTPLSQDVHSMHYQSRPHML
ncbi:hypothetical protein RRG08_034141 [Elysia crispata]|uniref:Uncharacterized protein n=1 Tax=Elysia crispata TaxID=231223 RepID=A0AAE0ZKQ2_9GAST|nr:hypothetical protein RRG08_034141 [Elysia crispata]